MNSNLMAFSLAAGLCTTAGAGLIFVKRKWSKRSLGFFLGLASGVMAGVVLLDMLPSALIVSDLRTLMGGTGLGILGLATLDGIRRTKISTSDSMLTLGYLVMLGIALHDLPEGMAIALGSEMKDRTGMVIALGIAIHNIPEGMAIAAPLLMAGTGRWRILWQTLLVGLVTPVGALFGFWLTDWIPHLLPFLLSFASGIMAYLVLFQLWPQARKQGTGGRWWGFWLGMAIIAVSTFI